MSSEPWRRFKRLGLLIGVLACFTVARGQGVTINGIVRDSSTRLPLFNVTISFKGSKGLRTDSSGYYYLNSDQAVAYLDFSIVGYKKKRVPVPQGRDSLYMDIYLDQLYSELAGVVITKKNKLKYSNKNNPAVDLIRQVIDHKAENRLTGFNTASYEKYDKLMVSLDRLSETLKGNFITRKFGFVFDNKDTTLIPGKSVTPIYLEEKISNYYYQQKPERSKTVIKAEKRVDYGEFVDSRGTSAFLNHLYADVDIYDNNLSLVTSQFLSPLADMGPTFYMYFIRDTTEIDGEKLIRLYFSPRNPNDLLLRGTLYITMDGRYAIRSLNMLVSKYANINFVRELKISQDFEKGSNGRYHVSKSNVICDFGFTKKGGGFVGERTVSYKNFTVDAPIPDSLFAGAAEQTLDDAGDKSGEYWVEHRHDTLSYAESRVYANIDSLRKMPSFKRVMDYGTLLLGGYKDFGAVEVGPVSTFYSFNPVEGFRLRFGGRTTPKLSPRFYTESYVAYGFKDERWKYFISGTYSLNNKSIYKFPFNYVRASFQRDTKIPGQELQFVQEDNFLLSFKRGDNNKWLYNDIFRLDYVHEFNNHFSYSLGVKYWKQAPAGKEFVFAVEQNGHTENLPDVTTGELSLELRYSPHEQFYQGKLYRIPIPNKYPVFRLRYVGGIDGFLGGQYTYQNILANVSKRFYLSQLGYTDITWEGAYLFGKVPFPLMMIHRANQTYSYQLSSYNMMNFLEFVSDRYLSLNIDHYFNGFFFNKVPLLKKAKLREVVTAKFLWGSIRAENDPSKTQDQMKFPVTEGVTSTYSLEGQPYLETSVGISNIFKIGRIDLVKRFAYLEHPGVPEWGVRVRFKFDF